MVKLVNPQPLTELESASHVVWAALEKIGHKELNAGELKDGSRHRVSLRIDGNVDDQPFTQTIESIVTLGFGQMKSSSVTPQVPQLVAYILSKLNQSTRNRLLSDIPGDFADNENRLPESDPQLLEDVKEMLKRLRATKLVAARGAIRCEYAF